MSNQVELVIAGTIGLDDISTPFGSVTGVLGGSASYSAIAASYFARPGIVSIVGADFPDQYRLLLADRQIDQVGVASAEKTFRWQGSYSFDLAEATTLGTELNALADFAPTLPADYQSASVLLLANIDPEIQSRLAAELPRAFTILDTMNFWIEGKRDQLLAAIRLADLLVLNEAEARQLTDERNLVKAAEQLRTLGPEFVIIKQGEHGALLFSATGWFSAPGYPLEVIQDPTGAGDSFAGALAGYLAAQHAYNEPTIRQAIVYGSTLASFCVEDFSVNRTNQLTTHLIEERYHAFRDLTQF